MILDITVYILFVIIVSLSLCIIFCVNVTVVIEHIVFLLTAACALISVCYIYLRLFFCLCLSFFSLCIT